MIRNLLPLNRVLLAIAVVLGVLLFVLRGGGVVQRAVEPLFPGFDGARATDIRIVAGSSRGSSDGAGDLATITITRATLDDRWSVRELFDGPAAPLFVEGLLSRIGEMTTLDLVSDDPARIDEYELGEGEAIRMTIESSATNPTGTTVGVAGSEDSPRDFEISGRRLLADVFVARGPGVAAFVRRAGDARVYRIARFPMPPTKAFGWFDRRSLMPYENVQIARVVARGTALAGVLDGALEDGELVIEQPLTEFGSFRDGDGRDLSRERVLDLLARLRALFPSAVLERRESGAFDPAMISFELEIEARGGNVFRLVFGALPESGVPAGGPGAGDPVPVMRSGDNLVVGCDRRAAMDVLAALRALAR